MAVSAKSKGRLHDSLDLYNHALALQRKFWPLGNTSIALTLSSIGDDQALLGNIEAAQQSRSEAK